MAKAIKEISCAVGCSNTFTAKAQHLPTVQHRNRAGSFMQPDVASFSGAAAAAEWTPQNSADVIHTSAPDAWPIVSPTFVLLPSNPAAEKMQATLGAMKLFDSAYRRGGDIARKLGCVPVPEAA